MKRNLFKITSLLFCICAVALFVLFQIDISANWISILKYVCIIIIVLIIIMHLIVFFVVKNDDKIIDSYLSNDNYDGLLDYLKQKQNKKSFILSARNNYYNYLEILSYVGKNDESKMDDLFDKYKNYDDHPIVYYWKACYEFSKDNTLNVKDYYNKFINNTVINKYQRLYQDIILLFYSLNLFVEDKIDETKKYLKRVNLDKINMPCAKKAIEVLNEKTDKKEEI